MVDRSFSEVKTEIARQMLENVGGPAFYELWLNRHSLCLAGVSGSYPQKMHPYPAGMQPNSGWLDDTALPDYNFHEDPLGPEGLGFPKPGNYFRHTIAYTPRADVSTFAGKFLLPMFPDFTVPPSRLNFLSSITV